ncbi:MAG: hypothetical protein ABIH99_00005, partial [Candidatus Micrarchaeota archaeon]
MKQKKSEELEKVKEAEKLTKAGNALKGVVPAKTEESDTKTKEMVPKKIEQERAEKREGELKRKEEETKTLAQVTQLVETLTANYEAKKNGLIEAKEALETKEIAPLEERYDELVADIEKL